LIMPVTCKTCEGRRHVQRFVTLRWWEKLAGKPDILEEACVACNGTGTVVGTAEEEDVVARRLAARVTAAPIDATPKADQPYEQHPPPKAEQMGPVAVSAWVVSILVILCFAILLGIATVGFRQTTKFTLTTAGAILCIIGLLLKDQGKGLIGLGAMLMAAAWMMN
jgi:hypothetical protein